MTPRRPDSTPWFEAPRLVFLWRPKPECQAIANETGYTAAIITLENQLWLCFALEYTIADGSTYHVRWRRVPRQRCEACGQIIK